MALDDAAIDRFVSSSGLSWVTPPPSHLECPICQCLLQEPVCCNSGAHCFCRKCLSDWMGRSATPHCPIDRDPLTPGVIKKAPQVLQECLDALEVICSLGCGWIGGQGKWAAHLKRDCPEVEGDPHEDRKEKTGTLPQALLDTVGSPERSIHHGSSSMQSTDERRAHHLLAEAAAPRRAMNATCDLCHADIYDVGYKCTSCPDYDICSDCWLNEGRSNHPTTHAFVRLTDRADFYLGNAEEQEGTTERRLRSAGGAGAAVHRGITCDGCEKDNIAGVRYHCLICDDFDLCQDCVNTGTRRGWTHRNSHDMTRITVPRSAD